MCSIHKSTGPSIVTTEYNTICDRSRVRTEVLKTLEKLVPVPGCALGHYDKAKARTPISSGYIASSRIAYGTYPMHRICSHIHEALQYGTPTVTAHDNVAHSGKAGCCTIHINIHMVVYVIPAVVTLID